jgi:hypothetical protein
MRPFIVVVAQPLIEVDWEFAHGLVEPTPAAANISTGSSTSTILPPARMSRPPGRAASHVGPSPAGASGSVSQRAAAGSGRP